ncbi:MAG: UDP-N-acetylmuramate:L-alanyl-gamma-D-glutamyl-meso-diaminopimelate ligase [bacterium]
MKKQHFHFLGICGTAMASCAAMLKAMGHKVTGSDNNIYPPMSSFLEKNKITVQKPFKPDNLLKKPDIVVVGNAISRGNAELEAVLNRGLKYKSMPEILKEFIITNKISVVCSGTHGKTTTTTLAAWVFKKSGLRPSFIIGGIPKNFKAGFGIDGGRHFIIEGDEYDTAYFDKRSKFMHYLPKFLIINNIEFDHADIFKNLNEILLSFRRVINTVPNKGMVIANGDDKNVKTLLDFARSITRVETFGIGSHNTWIGHAVAPVHGKTGFSVSFKNHFFGRFTIPLIGLHNVYNALAVIAVAHSNGIPSNKIEVSLKTFRGIKKRMELTGKVNDISVYDDFAHHPTAVAAVLDSVKKNYKYNRLWAVFEPRSNSTRRNIFQKELSQALCLADKVIIAPVNGAQNIPDQERFNIKSAICFLKENGVPARTFPSVENIADYAAEHSKPGDIIICMSNGSFENIHNRILRKIKGETISK